MRRILLLALAAAAIGCGSTTDTGNDTIVGTYTLVSVNGNALPTKNNNGATISAGSLSLGADGAFAFSETDSDGSHMTAGTYAVSGNNITFTPSTPGESGATGVVDGTTLTVQASDEGTLVLHKSS